MSLENEVKRYSFYMDMCSMYESRIEYYKENLNKKNPKRTEFDTEITENLIETFERGYESFKERNKHLRPGD